MEFVDGPNLRQWVDQHGPIGQPAEALVQSSLGEVQAPVARQFGVEYDPASEIIVTVGVSDQPHAVLRGAVLRIELVARVLLVRGAGRCILVETGVGDKFDDKSNAIYAVSGAMLPDEAVRAAGFDPDSVTDVLLTHLHFDHVGWMRRFLESLYLENITLFCQDWGGLIGLRLVASFPDRFAGVVASNTGLPAGMVPAEFAAPLRAAYKTLPVVKVTELDEKFRDDSDIPGFLYWRKFCAESPEFDVGQTLQLTAKNSMSEAVVAGYRAPFPDQSYMAGARKFPSLVPLLPDEDEVEENLAAWKVLHQFNKPFITAFADDDPASTGGEIPFQESVPGADGAPHRTIDNAGHFVQQDQPQACVQAILDLKAKGAVCFDYGNNLRGQVADRRGLKRAFDFPGFVPAFIRPLFCEGKGPFRWVALSGDPGDIHRTDELVLELFPDAQLGFGPPTDEGFYHGGDLAGLLDALDIEKAVFIGHDWGAPITYGAANHAPERWSKVVGLAVPPGPAMAAGRRPATRMASSPVKPSSGRHTPLISTARTMPRSRRRLMLPSTRNGGSATFRYCSAATRARSGSGPGPSPPQP